MTRAITLPWDTKIRPGTDQAIRKHEKLLLVLFPILLDEAVVHIKEGWPAYLRRTRTIRIPHLMLLRATQASEPSHADPRVSHPIVDIPSFGVICFWTLVDAGGKDNIGYHARTFLSECWSQKGGRRAIKNPASIDRPATNHAG